MDRTDLPGLVGDLYSGIFNRDRLAAFLQGLAVGFQSRASTIYDIDLDGRLFPFAFTHGLDPDAWADYEAYYVAIDPRVDFVQRNHDAREIYDYLVTDEEHIRKSEYYNWLNTNGFRYFVAERMASERQVLSTVTLQRSESQGHFSAREMSGFREIAAHVENFIRILRELSSRAELVHSLAQAIDCEQVPLAVLDAAGRVIHASTSFARHCAPGEGLTLVEGVLMPEKGAFDVRSRKPLDTRLGVILEPDRGPKCFVCPRSEDRAPIVVRVAPLDRSGHELSDTQHVAAIVLVIDPNREIAADATALAATYCMTAKEAETALLIAEGRSPKDVADLSGRSINTVRWQLKSIYDKLDVSSQHQLVRKVTPFQR
ncbi:MAG: helix-turn-helix domain-containing protein [Pseudomonadota bacterium]